MSTLSVLFIDNFDSFTFNLVDELRRREARVEVWRNDLSVDRALALALALPPPRLVVLSPGPGSPSEAGCCVELLRQGAGRVPFFGVCLGHQSMVEAFGGEVGSAGEIVHGKAAEVRHDGHGLFQGLPQPMLVGRYHSLTATRMPEALQVTARCGELVMGLRHRHAPLWGLQFHPESILTPRGGQLIDNVMALARAEAGPSKEAGGSPGPSSTETAGQESPS